MRFLLDQNVEARIGRFLNDHGHDAPQIGRDYPAGMPDQDVLAVAYHEQRVLITNDKDFGELIFVQHLHSGVILFRLPLDSTASEKLAALENVLAVQLNHLSRFLVVTPQGVRVR